MAASFRLSILRFRGSFNAGEPGVDFASKIVYK